MVTPGISIGYWNARKSPLRARSSGSSPRMFSPSMSTSPRRDGVVGMAAEHFRERAFAGAVRPHDGVDFPSLDFQAQAADDFLSGHIHMQIVDD